MLDAVAAFQALAGLYCAIKAVGTVDLVPFRLCRVGDFGDGAEGRCEGLGGGLSLGDMGILGFSQERRAN